MIRKSTLVFLLPLLVLSLTTPAWAHGTTKLVGGRWPVEGRFEERTLYMVDGVLRTAAPGEVDATLDLGGGFVVPPLADAHNHGLADAGFEEESRRFLAAGIFYVQNPNSLRSWTLAAREQARSPETVDVRYAMAGLTSTGGHPAQIYDRAAADLEGWTPERMRGEAYVVVDDEDDLEAAWPQIVSGGPDFLKTYLEHSEEHALRKGDDAYYGRRGLDPELLPAIVARTHANGLRVSTHVTTAADFRTAVAAGADEIAHLPLERLEPADARAAAEAGTVVVTTTLSHRPTEGIEDLDAVHRHNLELLLAHGVPLVLGTDSGRSVLEEAENLVRLGLDPALVFTLATERTARWIFPDRDVGRLTPGAEASFVVLAADPRQDMAAFRNPLLLVKAGHRLDLAAEVGLPGIGQALVPILMGDGVEAAVAEYRRLLKEEPEAWDFSEPQLNALGYAALGHGNTEAALAAFRLNAERFPESANVWDSLGDGLVEAGELEEAREAYRRALAIDPGAEHTRKKLEEAEGHPGAEQER